MRFHTRAILAVNVVGAFAALGRQGQARFAGVRLPGSPIPQALTVGTAMSAPPVMLGALVIGARRGRFDVVRLLSALFIVGILGEPDTWSVLRRPRSDPLASACVALEIVLPTALLWRTMQPDADAPCGPSGRVYESMVCVRHDPLLVDRSRHQAGSSA